MAKGMKFKTENMVQLVNWVVFFLVFIEYKDWALIEIHTLLK